MYKNKKILIVEDEEGYKNSLKMALEKEGHEIFTAGNGEVGLTMALNDHPHLIIIDLIMPRMDGSTMLDQLRYDAWGSQVPVIILTNLNPQDTMYNKLLLNQPSSYLIKTKIQIQDVVQKVNEIVNEKL
ncbi:hypothetical protein A2866_02405 [Candidatus Roizmanbacteria bacterium RIFCSPHIGHO2_01_FULL_39_8]|uniref:Response regulatory domain-containing protein n=2 Tax=Candidatus Roizmaniibacteriota TaxID=1752723 RepID=A0A1F7GT26_9BACT|nr:MAG: hypothetical protein A2866_02405 [Candidatus Roizmanbacteria bacterium RIFCSPHIGHO2_01_FULL_39_8]OGK25242.1 MAG: hypothetical protein A3C28_02405 [Candidatus Roizmanbacteria bacterium RIFCSPHIGHO2_02_FULL_39_9]